VFVQIGVWSHRSRVKEGSSWAEGIAVRPAARLETVVVGAVETSDKCFHVETVSRAPRDAGSTNAKGA
jgi:hypothetical protein